MCHLRNGVEKKAILVKQQAEQGCVLPVFLFTGNWYRNF